MAKEKIKIKRGLTPKQLAFAREFVQNGRHAAEAARKAGYSEKGARQAGHVLLTNRDVMAEVERLAHKVEKKFDVSFGKIIEELAAVAFGHAGRVMTWDHDTMQFIPKDEMNEADMKFIESITISNSQFGSSLQMRTMAREKVRALETLARLLGYDKQEGGETPHFVTALKDAFKRLDEKRQVLQIEAQNQAAQGIGVTPINTEKPSGEL